MGPRIILDKSALQALSQSEIGFLVKHYFIVVTPVLIMEILADLKKGTNEIKLSRNEVMQLSKKLLPGDSCINTHYKDLCVGSLLGHNIPMSGQARVSGGISIKTPDGKEQAGVFFKESAEEKALRNWREGSFSNTEEILAQRWRETTRDLDLEHFKRKFKAFTTVMPKIKDFEELRLYVEKFTSSPDPQIQFLGIDNIMDGIGILQQHKNVIYNRWIRQKYPLFRDFAPYSYFCFKVSLIFCFGLALDLISTKPTNWIDLEYLYYLPFCMVFCSGDKFHKDICPSLLRNDQEFVDRNKLKEDLHWLSAEWDSLNKAEKRDRAYNYGSYPPTNPKSVTYRLWQKYMKPWKPGSGNIVAKMTKEEQDRILRELQPLFDEIDRIDKYKDKNNE